MYHVIYEWLEKPEQVRLSDAEYFTDKDGVQSACFTFTFEGPDDTATRIREWLTSKKSTGVITVWVSIPDAAIYYMNAVYGITKGDI